jgi:hypothetical protein
MFLTILEQFNGDNIMAYFAQIDEFGVVIRVISINNSVIGEPEISFPQTELFGKDFILNILGFNGEWLQTSYNKSFRKNYAGVGYTYDFQLDSFVPPKPYPSWVLNESTCLWDSPIQYPNDGKHYIWDEETISWSEIVNDPV